MNNGKHFISPWKQKNGDFPRLSGFFKFIYFNWRLITLQYCGGFCHTLTWISPGCACVPHHEPPSYLPSSKSFVALAMTLKSLTHFALILYMVWGKGPTSLFPLWRSVSQHHLWKRLSLCLLRIYFKCFIEIGLIYNVVFNSAVQ